MQYGQYYFSPIGKLLLIGDKTTLHGLYFESEQNTKLLTACKIITTAHHPIFCQTMAILDKYFAKQPIPFSQFNFLSAQGTPFQQQVWQALRDIPYGKSVSYSDIANLINNPKAVRAVGSAIGANPISILIPCHRVLGKNGTLTGFSGGLSTKRYLLDLENIPYCEK